MKITRVYYERIFPIAPYINEKVGVEATLGDLDDWAQALTELKRMTEEWHYANKITIIENEYSSPPDFANMPETISASPGEVSIGITVKDILSCNSLVVLKAYRKLVDGNSELESAYLKRHEELILNLKKE